MIHNVNRIDDSAEITVIVNLPNIPANFHVLISCTPILTYPCMTRKDRAVTRKLATGKFVTGKL